MGYKKIPGLECGDIVAIAFNNHFRVGIFYRWGPKVDNLHYWPLYAATYLSNNVPREIGKKFSFLSCEAVGRVVKIEAGVLSPEQLEAVTIIRELAIKQGIIKLT